VIKEYQTGKTCESILDTSIDSRSTCVPTTLFKKTPTPTLKVTHTQNEIKELEEKKSRLVLEIQKLSTSLVHLKSVN